MSRFGLDKRFICVLRVLKVRAVHPRCTPGTLWVLQEAGALTPALAGMMGVVALSLE